MIREKILDQVKVEHLRIASYVRPTGLRLGQKDRNEKSPTSGWKKGLFCREIESVD